MPFNGIQIQNQIDANFSAIQNINLQLRQSNLPAWKRVQMDKDLARLWNAQRYWAAEYKKATGETMLLVAPMILVGDPEEEQRTLNQRLAQEKVVQEARLRLKEGIRTATGEYHSIRLLLQEHYDIATSWQNAFISDWARMGAGLSIKHPLFLKKSIEEKAWPAIMAAEAAFAKGEYAKAWKQVGIAARWVKWGYDSLNWWLDRLEVGGARAVATIKVSAALATLVASAPVELGILGTVTVGAMSEGSQQGMGLLATALDPKASVSLEDVKKAAMATAINAGSAGAGKILGKVIAKGLIGMVAKRYLSEGASEAAVKFFETRIEQYVGANAQAIANKMLKLDTEPDWNWWYMLITPCLNGVAIEMAKEPELQKMLKK